MSREILLVDDERSVRIAIKGVLERAGWTVREASDVESAMEALVGSGPSLVLLDVMMPGTNGYEACRRMKKIRPELPVVFLTALDRPENEITGLETGADDYVSKSAPPEVLVARVRSALRRSGGGMGEFVFGGWKVVSADFSMCDGEGRRVSLTERETAFLRELGAHPNELFSRDYLSRMFVDAASVRFDDALGVFVGRLRAKLGRSAACIRTVHGQGYSYWPQGGGAER